MKTLIPLLTDDEDKQMQIMTFAYKRISQGFKEKLPPVLLSIRLYQDLYRMESKTDPYSEIKQRSIEAAEKALPAIMRVVKVSKGYEKLRASLSASIAGNVIDFNTAYHKPDLTGLFQVFQSIMREGFSPDDSKLLWQLLDASQGHAVVLADNAGETHFDVPLLKILKERGWKTTYVVKMQPMINDATRDDIKGSRIETLADIADNGAWAHGVPREYVSKEFLNLIKQSDLVLSKGQANVETFPEIQQEIGVTTYYIIRAKCPHIAQAVGANVGDNVVLRRPAI